MGLSGVALPQSAQRPLRKSSKTHFLCDLCGLPHQMPENPKIMIQAVTYEKGEIPTLNVNNLVNPASEGRIEIFTDLDIL